MEALNTEIKESLETETLRGAKLSDVPADISAINSDGINSDGNELKGARCRDSFTHDRNSLFS